MMLRRWMLLARPIETPDPSLTAFSWSLAEAFNQDPEFFFTRRGAHSAARFHTGFLPVTLEAVRRLPMSKEQR